MKTKIFAFILLLAIFGLSIGLFAQPTQIIDKSWTDTVYLGSSQWVEVTPDLSLSNGGSMSLVIMHWNPNWSFTGIDTLFFSDYRDFTNNTPPQLNGNYRVHFTMPSQYHYSEFTIIACNQWTFAPGTFASPPTTPPSSLPTLTPSIPNHTKTYYTLQGQLTTDPHGIVVETTPTTRRLVYLP